MAKRHYKKYLVLLVQIFALLFIVISLVWSPARELHVLVGRLLFGFNGDRFVVEGQPAGCVLSHVPLVHLTEEYEQSICDESSNGPDEYILAANTTYQEINSPEPRYWENNKHMDWAAFHLAEKIIDKVRYGSSKAENNNEPPDVAIDKMIADCFMVIQFAQEKYSNNGALWLAEAAVHFARNDDAAGITALKIACTKPRWGSGEAGVFLKVYDSLRKNGFTFFDATITCDLHCMGDHSFSSVTWFCTKRIHSLMADAVERQKHCRFSELSHLLCSLQEADRPTQRSRNRFCRLPSIDDDTGVVYSIAQVLGHDLDAVEKMEYRDRRTWGEDLLKLYFHDKLDRELADTLLDRDTHYRNESIAGSHLRDYTPYLISIGAGRLAIIMFVLLLILILIELPFLWRKKDIGIDEKRVKNSIGFSVVVLASVTSAIWIMYHTMGSINQPVGLRCNSDDFLSSSQENFLFAASIGSLILLLRFLITGNRSLLLMYQKMIPVAFSVYAFFICLAAYFRNIFGKSIMADVLSGNHNILY